MNEHRKDIMWRVKLIYLLLFLYGIAIIGRIMYIQFVEGAMWKAKAEKLSFRYQIPKVRTFQMNYLTKKLMHWPQGWLRFSKTAQGVSINQLCSGHTKPATGISF